MVAGMAREVMGPKEKVDEMFFLSDTWISQDARTRPSLADDRREAVTLTGGGRYPKTWFAMVEPYKRGKNNEIKWLKMDKNFDSDTKKITPKSPILESFWENAAK
jgi:hypothetical protein